MTVTIHPAGPHTWWDLAAAHLGAGERWSELWHLNQGRPEPGGVRLTSPGVLRDGWTILIPAPPDTAEPTPATASPAAPSDSAPAAQEATTTGPAAAPRHQRVNDSVVTVRAGDSLAAIATRHGTSWTALWAANRGRPEPGGTKFADPDVLEPGWTIAVPTPPPATPAASPIAVQPGDTLSGIAARHHLSTAELWAANHGRAEPGGGHLTDPDLIEPGWTLTLPSTPPRRDTQHAHRRRRDHAASATAPAGPGHSEQQR